MPEEVIPGCYKQYTFTIRVSQLGWDIQADIWVRLTITIVDVNIVAKADNDDCLDWGEGMVDERGEDIEGGGGELWVVGWW